MRIKIVRINLKKESAVVSLVETMVRASLRLLWTSLNKQKGADHETYCYGEDEEGWETRCHGERLRYSLLGTSGCTWLYVFKWRKNGLIRKIWSRVILFLFPLLTCLNTHDRVRVGTVGNCKIQGIRPLFYSKLHVTLIAFAIDTLDSLDNVTMKVVVGTRRTLVGAWVVKGVGLK